jgi:hypothetical protein
MTPSSVLLYSLVMVSSCSAVLLSDGELEGGNDFIDKCNGLKLEREIDQTPSQAAHLRLHPSNISAFNVFPSPPRVPTMLSKASTTCSREVPCDLRAHHVGSGCTEWNGRPGTERTAAHPSWNLRPRAPLMRIGGVGCGGSFGGIHGSFSQCPALPFPQPPTVLRVRGGGWLSWAPTAPAPKPSPPAASERAARRDAGCEGDRRSGPSWWQRNR